MTQQSLDPVPNVPILEDPTKDAILKRWLAQIVTRVASTGQIDHNTLLNLNVGDYQHLTAARNTTLTGTQSANTVLAGPTTGAAAISAFRALVAADLPAGSGTVTSVSFTGGLISVATATTTPALTVAGTSGGIPYFSSGTTWASTGALTANALLIGGGAGAGPSALGSLGTTTTVLHGNASGAPTFGAVSLAADVTGTLPYGNGGTGATALTDHGVVTAGAAALGTVAPSTIGNVLTSNGTDWTSVAPATSGTVTSVAETVSVATAPTSNLSVSGSPITSAGTLALSISPWWAQKDSIDTGETLTIAAGYSVPFYGACNNSGTINNSGTRVIL